MKFSVIASFLLPLFLSGCSFSNRVATQDDVPAYKAASDCPYLETEKASPFYLDIKYLGARTTLACLPEVERYASEECTGSPRTWIAGMEKRSLRERSERLAKEYQERFQSEFDAFEVCLIYSIKNSPIESCLSHVSSYINEPSSGSLTRRQTALDYAKSFLRSIPR